MKGGDEGAAAGIGVMVGLRGLDVMREWEICLVREKKPCQFPGINI